MSYYSNPPYDNNSLQEEEDDEVEETYDQLERRLLDLYKYDKLGSVRVLNSSTEDYTNRHGAIRGEIKLELAMIDNNYVVIDTYVGQSQSGVIVIKWIGNSLDDLPSKYRGLRVMPNGTFISDVKLGSTRKHVSDNEDDWNEDNMYDDNEYGRGYDEGSYFTE